MPETVGKGWSTLLRLSIAFAWLLTELDLVMGKYWNIIAISICDQLQGRPHSGQPLNGCTLLFASVSVGNGGSRRLASSAVCRPAQRLCCDWLRPS